MACCGCFTLSNRGRNRLNPNSEAVRDLNNKTMQTNMHSLFGSSPIKVANTDDGTDERGGVRLAPDFSLRHQSNLQSSGLSVSICGSQRRGRRDAPAPFFRFLAPTGRTMTAQGGALGTTTRAPSPEGAQYNRVPLRSQRRTGWNPSLQP